MSLLVLCTFLLAAVNAYREGAYAAACLCSLSAGLSLAAVLYELVQWAIPLKEDK